MASEEIETAVVLGEYSGFDFPQNAYFTISSKEINCFSFKSMIQLHRSAAKTNVKYVEINVNSHLKTA